MSPRRAIPKKMTFFWDKKLYFYEQWAKTCPHDIMTQKY